MKNILLALDLKENTELLIAKAEQMAGKFDAKVWVVHIAAPDPDFVGNEVGPQYIRDDRAEKLRGEHRKLQEIAETISAKGINAESLLVQGPTVETIMQEASKLHADLLVLGGREHSFFEKILKGSTTSEILKKSEIPLLIIPLK